MNSRTKKLVTTGMLCALAYIAVAVGRIPIVLFLKYDPKDVIIVTGGFLFGPLASLAVAVVVSMVEMVTISGTGIWGCMMNVFSSCAFACTAAFLYRRKRKISGAMIGLLGGWCCQVAVMMLWNYLVAPIYMGYPRAEVVKLLLPAFLPFNLIKGGLNVSLTLLLYKPVVTALRRSRLIEPSHAVGKARLHAGVALTAAAIMAACVLAVFLIKGV